MYKMKNDLACIIIAISVILASIASLEVITSSGVLEDPYDAYPDSYENSSFNPLYQ
jgi:hypothetical protein